MVDSTRGEVIGRNVRALREDAILTQEQVAGDVGISPSQYNLLENGKVSRPHPRTLRKIASYFGVSPQELRNPEGISSPKEQAPSSPAESPERRRENELRNALERAVSFHAARESIEAYCDYVETTLADAGGDRRATDDFLAASDAFLHALQIDLDAELYILEQETGLARGNAVLSRLSEIHQAAQRYMEIYTKIVDARATEEGDSDAEHRRQKIREWTERISA